MPQAFYSYIEAMVHQFFFVGHIEFKFNINNRRISIFVQMRIPSNKIADVVRFFRDELQGQYDKSELETFIAYCFEEFLGIKRNEIVLKGNDTMSESELLKFNFAIKDLKNNRPIQHILGKADFYGLKFYVNEHVLIPRPETEELVHLVIQENVEGGSQKEEKKAKDAELKTNDSRLIAILDIGTGSGCIPIVLKKKIPSAKVYTLDISEKVLAIAKRNAKLNEVDIEFAQHDILSEKQLPVSFPPKFDIIVSNPPYVRNLEKENIDRNVLDHEPHLALFVSDEDPLIFYKTIADLALNNLKKEGKIYFEINEYLGEETKEILVNKGFKNVQLLKDINGKNRILRGEI